MVESKETSRPVSVWRRSLRWSLLVLAGLAVFPFLFSFFVPWTRICCREDEVNLKTGQARYSQYYWYVRYSRGVRDTPLSAALGDTRRVSSEENAWRMVNVFSPGLKNSPHFSFHGALHQAHLFDQIAAMYGWELDRRKDVAAGILQLWQATNSDSAADTYLNGLLKAEMGKVPRK